MPGAGTGIVCLFVQVRAVGYLGGDGFFAYRTTIEPLVLAAPALVLATVGLVRSRGRVALALVPLALVSIGVHAYGAVVGGISDDTTRAWEQVDHRLQEEHEVSR